MIFQGTPYSCGAAAVVNACRAFGNRKITETAVMVDAGTVEKHGTQPEGIQQALGRAGHAWHILSEVSFLVAQERLVRHLRDGYPAIILTEQGDHWETAIGMLGHSCIIIDPQNTKMNLRQNGVHIVPQGRQLRRYWTAGLDNKRYAILVV